MARIRTVLGLLAAALLVPAGSAWAQSGWLNQEVARLSALPHTLLDVSSNHWLQITGGERQTHGVAEDEYRAILPRLDALAAAAQPDLERELDTVLNGLSVEGLRATAARQPISYCSWIGTARPDGVDRPASNLRATLFARCRATAPAVVTNLLNQHVDTLGLILPALPRLDPLFPRWLLADLAQPDESGAIALDPIQLQAAHQDRLARRIAAATPGIRSDLDRAYAARTWRGGPIESPDTDCQSQLGPLAAGDLGDHCRGAATRWIAFLLPSMSAALPGAIAAALAANPSLDENALCRAVLAPWLPEGLPGTIQVPVRNACLSEARRAIAQAAADRAKAIADAITARANQLAAPILAVPRTYASLLARGWYGQPTTSWDDIVPTAHPDAASVRTRAQAEYERLIAPAADAAWADARQRIGAAYAQAAGSTSADSQIRVLCGPDRRGGSLPPAPGSQDLRNKTVAACVEASDTLRLARTRIALERAGLRADDRTILIVTADGELRLPLVKFVEGAATVGLQVRTTTGKLGFGARLLVTPLGAETPVLSGSVSKSQRGLLLDTIDPLPGWPADAVDTVQCLIATEEDLANAQLSALLTMLGSVFAADADRPRTAGALMRNGLSQLQEVQSRRACLKARQSFVDQPAGG